MAAVLSAMIDDLSKDERGRPRVRRVVILIIDACLDRITFKRGDEPNQRVGSRFGLRSQLGPILLWRSLIDTRDLIATIEEFQIKGVICDDVLHRAE